MFTRDIHSNKETVKDALYELDNSILMAKKMKEHILCLIIGYGSHGTKHKINSAILDALKEYKEKNKIKDYILGSNLYIFNTEYQKFKGKEYIPDTEKTKRNNGAVYIYI